MKHFISNVDALRYLDLKRCCGKSGRCSANEKNVAYICEQYRQYVHFRAMVNKTLQEDHKCRKQSLVDNTLSADMGKSAQQASETLPENSQELDRAQNCLQNSKCNENNSNCSNECVPSTDLTPSGISTDPTPFPLLHTSNQTSKNTEENNQTLRKHKKHYISAPDIARYLKLAKKTISKKKGYEMVRFQYSYYADFRALVDATLLADKEKSEKQASEIIPLDPVISPISNSSNQATNEENKCLKSLAVNEIQIRLKDCMTAASPKQSEIVEDLSPSSNNTNLNNSNQLPKTTRKHYIARSDICRFLKLKMKSYSQRKGCYKVRYKYSNNAKFRDFVNATLLADKEKSAKQASKACPEDHVASAISNNNQIESQVEGLHCFVTDKESRIPSSSCATQPISQISADLNPSSLSNSSNQRSRITRQHFISRSDVAQYLKLTNTHRPLNKFYEKVRAKYTKDAEFRASVDSILLADKEKSAKQAGKACCEDPIASPISNNNQVENQVTVVQCFTTDEVSVIPSSSYESQPISQISADLNPSSLSNSSNQRSKITRKHFISRSDVAQYLKLTNTHRPLNKFYEKVRDKYTKNAEFRASVDSILLADKEKSGKQAGKACSEDPVASPISNNNQVENQVTVVQCFATDEESVIPSSSYESQPISQISADLNPSSLSNSSNRRSKITRQHFISRSDVARYLKLTNTHRPLNKFYEKVRDKYTKNAEFRASVDYILLVDKEKSAKQAGKACSEDPVASPISNNNQVENQVTVVQCFATDEESVIPSSSYESQPISQISADVSPSSISNTSNTRSRITRPHFISKSDVARYLKLINKHCSIQKGYYKIRDKYSKDAEFRASVDSTLLADKKKSTKQTNKSFHLSNKKNKMKRKRNEINCDVYQLRNRAAPKTIVEKQTIEPITKKFSDLQISLFDICQYLMLKKGPTFRVTINHIEDTLRLCKQDSKLCDFVSKTVQERKYQASDDPAEINFLKSNKVQASFEDSSLLPSPVSETIPAIQTTPKFYRISCADARLYIMLKSGTVEKISRQKIDKVRVQYQSDETFRNAVLHMFQDVDGHGTKCCKRLLQDVLFNLLGEGKTNSVRDSQEIEQPLTPIATESSISTQPVLEQCQIATQSNALSASEILTSSPPKKRSKIVLEISKHSPPKKTQKLSLTGTPHNMDILSQAVEVLNVPEASSFMTLEPHGQLQQQTNDIEYLRLPVIDDDLSNETPEVSDGEVTPYYTPFKESSPSHIVEIGFNDVTEQANLDDLVEIDASYALNSTSESVENVLDNCQDEKKVEIEYLDDSSDVPLLGSSIRHSGINAKRKVKQNRTFPCDDSDCEAVTLDSPAGGTFLFPRDVWKRCKRSQVRRLFKDVTWRSVVLKNLKSLNSVCSFVFNRHYVNRKKSGFGMFCCHGYCNFSVCSNEFQVKLDEDLTAHVEFVGTVRHKPSENATNRLTTNERSELKEILKSTSVEEYEKFQMASLTPEEIAAGNRNGCPSRAMLNKIRSQSLREVLKEANRQLLASIDSDGNDWAPFKCKKDHKRKSFFRESDENEESEDSDKDESFFRHPTPAGGQFKFSREVWERCRRSEDRRRFVSNEWAVEVRSKLKEFNSMCSLCFTSHFLRTSGSRRNVPVPVITCRGYCRFPTCSVRFYVTIDEHLDACVKFKGRLKHHKSDKIMHRIRGVERDRIRKILMTTSVTEYYNAQFEKLTQAEIDSGCRDRCPSKVVLKQIRAEALRLMEQKR